MNRSTQTKVCRYWILVFGIIALCFAPTLLAATWEPMGPPGATVFTMARVGSQPNTLYAGTYFGGIYKSTDNGLIWSHLPCPCSDSAIFDIAVDSTNPSTLYVATFGQGAFKSTDAGISWNRLGNGLNDSTVNALAVNPFKPSIVLAGTRTGVFKSVDAGASWTASNGGLSLEANTIDFDPNLSGVVYLGTASQGVLKSTDGGSSWSPFSTGMAGSSIVAVELGSGNPAQIYAATGAGVYRRSASGSAWQDITADLPQGKINQIKPNPATGDLFASSDSGLYRAPGTGGIASWAKLANIPSRAVDFSLDGSLIHVASLLGSLLATTDGGKNWFPTHDGLQNIFIGGMSTDSFAGYSVLSAGTELGVLTTSDLFGVSNGKWHWAKDQNLNEKVFTLVAHPAGKGAIFAGTESSGVWSSTDFGSHWTQKSDGLVPQWVFSIGQDKWGLHTLYAGSSEGLYLSADDGLSWRKAMADSTPVLSIAPHPIFPNVAYFGTFNGQVFTTLDGGKSVVPAGVSGLPSDGLAVLKIAPWSNFHAVTTKGEYYASGDQGKNWYRSAPNVTARISDIAFDPAKPWFLYLATVGGGVYKSGSGGLDWQPSNTGLSNPYIFSLAVDPNNTATLYAGSVDRVYKSIDGGKTWANASAGLGAGQVSTILFDPNDSRTLYASVAGNGIYKSVNAGANWSIASTGIAFSKDWIPLAIHPLNSKKLYTSVNRQAIYATGDAGLTWSPASRGMSLFVRGLAIDKTDPNLMYAASFANGMFKSMDGGGTWQNVGIGNTYLFDVAINPKNPQQIFAASALGINRSSNGGQSWHLLGQRTAAVFAVLPSPSNPLQVLIGGLAGMVCQSADGGDTWSVNNSGLPASDVFAMAQDPVSGTLYAAPEGAGIYKSSNGGSTWAATNMAANSAQHISAFTVDSATQTVYAASSGGGIWRSTDAGAHWATMNSGLAGLVMTSVVIDGNNLFATAFGENSTDPGLYRWSSTTQNWVSASNGITTNKVYTLVKNASIAGVLLAGTDKGVFRSANNGASWQAVASGAIASGVTKILFDRSVPGLVYAGTAGQGIYKSMDGGLNWLPSNTGAKDGMIHDIQQGNDGTLYAGTLNHGLIKSNNRGTNWSGDVSAAFLENPMVLAIEPDPTNPAIVYAGTGSVGILKSSNGGINWAVRNSGLTNFHVFDLAIDPVQPSTLYAATGGAGVFVSDDSGEHWSPLGSGLPHMTVTRVAIDRVNPKIVYAGTEGGGIYRNIRP